MRAGHRRRLRRLDRVDSDPVFDREARAAADVLSQRLGAAGCTIVPPAATAPRRSAAARFSAPATLAVIPRPAHRRVMDRNEDALILYTTSHGTPFGLYYHDTEWLRRDLAQLGCARCSTGSASRIGLLIVSAPALFGRGRAGQMRSPTSAIVTAASAERTSFGCAADQLTGDLLPGDATINPRRGAAAVAAAFVEAQAWRQLGGAGPGPRPPHPQINARRRSTAG